MEKNIKIEGARVHNLKNVSVEIPREKLVVMTGLSGSGKSSLAFDTIYAEGQRRYVESLSSYARMFLGQMDKPDVDNIEGLSPAISIDQKTTSKNPRSTVGTVTEIYDYLRLLYARVGTPHCPKCGREVKKQSIDQVVDRVLELEEGTRIQVLAPVVRGKKGEHKKVFENAKKNGFVRVKINGEQYDLSEVPELKKTFKYTIEIIVDRLIIRDGAAKRLSDSLETAFGLTEDVAAVEIIGGETIQFNRNFACDECGISLQEPSPRMFSFNNPYGACPDCSGIGELSKIDPSLLVANEDISLIEGAVHCTGWAGPEFPDSMAHMYYTSIAKHYGFDINTPWRELSDKVKNVVLFGSGKEKIEVSYKRPSGYVTQKVTFEGVANNLERRYHETTSSFMKRDLERYINFIPCRRCGGKRLSDEVLAVTVGGKNIYEFTCMSVRDELDFIENLTLTEHQQIIAEQIIKEIVARLKFLVDVGLDYLTLSVCISVITTDLSQRSSICVTWEIP